MVRCGEKSNREIRSKFSVWQQWRWGSYFHNTEQIVRQNQSSFFGRYLLQIKINDSEVLSSTKLDHADELTDILQYHCVKKYNVISLPIKPVPASVLLSGNVQNSKVEKSVIIVIIN